MGKTLIVLSAIFVISAPGLAAGWEESFYPRDQALTQPVEFEAVVQGAVRTHSTAGEQETGWLGKIGKLAFGSVQKALETPGRLLSQVIGRNEKPSKGMSGASEKGLAEGNGLQKLEFLSDEDFSLRLNTPSYAPLFQRSEEIHVANQSKTGHEKLGDENSIKTEGSDSPLMIQILLQDIVPSDE